MGIITQSIAPVVTRLYTMGAGMMLSIFVAFAVAKLARVNHRSTRRTIFHAVGVAGFLASWYIAFQVIKA